MRKAPENVLIQISVTTAGQESLWVRNNGRLSRNRMNIQQHCQYQSSFCKHTLTASQSLQSASTYQILHQNHPSERTPFVDG